MQVSAPQHHNTEQAAQREHPLHDATHTHTHTHTPDAVSTALHVVTDTAAVTTTPPDASAAPAYTSPAPPTSAATQMATYDWSVERILNAFPAVAQEAATVLPLALAEHDLPTEARTRLVLATAQTYLERHQEADEHFRIARQAFEQLGDARGVLFVNGRHAMVLHLCGETQSAEQQLLRGLSEARERDDAELLVEHLTNLAYVVANSQRFHDAISYLQESRAQSLRINSQLGQILAALNLASIYIDLRDYESAAPMCHEALDLIDDYAPFATLRCHFLLNLALIEERTGSPETAIERYTEAAEAAASRHHLRLEVTARLHEARLRRAQGDADGALALYRIVADRWALEPAANTAPGIGTPIGASTAPPPNELAALAQWGVEALTGTWTWETAHRLEAVLAAGRPPAKELRIEWSDALAEAYRGLGDHTAAFRQLQYSIVLREEVWSETFQLQAYATAHAEQARAARERAEAERWRREEADRTLAQVEAMNSQNATLISQLQQQTALLEQLSRTDDLTGLSNRRHFDEHFRTELNRARRFGRPLTIGLADIDDFKRVNDEWSHATGDHVLQALAQILSDATRDTDLVARYGGEEFALLLAETPLEEAAVLAERIRSAVEAYPWDTIMPGICITISIGLWAAADAASPEDAFARADERMYRAKRAGKNRVVAL